MSVPHILSFAQRRQRAIDLFARDRATLDIKQLTRIATEKTNHAVLGVHGDAVAIRILVRRGNNRSYWKILELADSLERLAHLSPLDGKLMFVSDVLVRAATASAEIRALWRYAIRSEEHTSELQSRFGISYA